MQKSRDDIALHGKFIENTIHTDRDVTITINKQEVNSR